MLRRRGLSWGGVELMEFAGEMSKIRALTDRFPLNTFGMLTPNVGGGYEDVHCRRQDSRQVLSSVIPGCDWRSRESEQIQVLRTEKLYWFDQLASISSARCDGAPFRRPSLLNPVVSLL